MSSRVHFPYLEKFTNTNYNVIVLKYVSSKLVLVCRILYVVLYAYNSLTTFEERVAPLLPQSFIASHAITRTTSPRYSPTITAPYLTRA